MTRRGIFGWLGALLTTVAAKGAALAKPRKPIPYPKDGVWRAKTPEGVRTQVVSMEGKAIGNAYAACPKEGWLDTWAIDENGRVQTTPWVTDPKTYTRSRSVVRMRVFVDYRLVDRPTGVVVARSSCPSRTGRLRYDIDKAERIESDLRRAMRESLR